MCHPIARLVLLFGAIGIGSGCSKPESPSSVTSVRGPATRAEAKLVIAGSSTLAPLITEIGRRFQESHPGVQITVQAGGSGRGIKDARERQADIGMCSRALTDAESDLVGFSIARDGICLLVHADNPVESLTDAQVSGIYTGVLTNWQQVGGADAPVFVITRSEGRGEVELFLHYFKIAKADIRAQADVGDNPVGIESVSSNRNAVVYVSVGLSERSRKAGRSIRLLPTSGIEASSQKIRTGDYPLSRSLVLVTKGLPAGLAKDFINYCLSPQVTDLIRQQDFVPYLD